MTTAPSVRPPLGRRWILLIPVASVMYLLAYFDRTNLSFVLPQMDDDLHLTATDKGLVSGIFFIGYFFTQVPAAIIAQKWSAKYVVLILMVFWGLCAVWTGLVHNTGELFTARFFLGVFEGGVQPATLILLSRWFPQKERARASGLWLLAIPLAPIIAAPITGTLLSSFDWRGVMILEGLPPLVWAIVWFFVIADTPRRARWASAREAADIETAIAADEVIKTESITTSTRYRDVVKNPIVIALVAAWFLYNAGFYGFTLWLPQVLSDMTGGSTELVGFLTAIPYVFGLAAMVVISTRTDRLGSRRTTVLVPLSVAAVALVVGQFVGGGVPEYVLLCVVAAGLYVHGAFFALPPLLLRTEVLAVGLGLIGGIGNLGGFLGPYIVGWLDDVTGSTALGFVLLGAAIAGCGVLLAAVTPRRPRLAVAAPEAAARVDA
ncbi:MFS transporter [Frondihabitans australicus]|uniref:Sugar phosphate permease n=1 Tax=Frondihabitans australicus TaxID=386892 RepID=A0A495IC72_9MICO|nr:MFS transporter [Frondihabitans australicus]RKR73519.1 sugar phosphate permease [Frondihabitans australicus]